MIDPSLQYEMQTVYLGGGFQLDAGVQQLQDHFDVSFFGGQV